jgi:hypothetical protein
MWKSILNEAKKSDWAYKLVESIRKDVVRELQQSYTSGKNRKRFINWLVSKGSTVSGLGGGNRKTATNMYDSQVLKFIVLALKTPVELGNLEPKTLAAYYPTLRKIIISNDIVNKIEKLELEDSGYARYGITHDLRHEFFHAIDHLIGNQLTQIKDRNINWRLFSDSQPKALKQIGKKDMSNVPEPLQVYLKDSAEGWSEYKALQTAIDKLGKPITPELIKKLCKRKWSLNKRQIAIMSYLKAKRAGDTKGMKKHAFWNRPEDAVLALPILHAIDCTMSGYKEAALRLQKLAGVVPGQLSKNIAEEVESTKELKALVFGHSQTQGMGFALRGALIRKGIKNIVYAPYPGFNDRGLAGKIKKVAKDPSSFTHVFLYLGGNLGQKNPNTMTGHMTDIINHFTSNGVNKDNIFVTLPPVNVPKIQRAMKMRPSKRELAYWKKKTKKDRSASWIKWRMSKWMEAQDFFESFLKTQLSSSNVIRVKGKVSGDGIHAKRSDAVTTQHINLILSNFKVQPGEMERGIAVDNPEVPRTRQIAESEEAAKPKVLICGHSQVNNMGRALKKMLKSKGYDVVVEKYDGANDAKIASLLPKWAPEPSEFTHVVVYCGGNVQGTNARLRSLAKIINYFKTAEGGPTKDNIFLVLPPTNKEPVKRRINNKANAADIKWARKKYKEKLEGKTDEYVRIFLQNKTLKAFRKQMKILKTLREYMPKENVIKIFGKWSVSRGGKPSSSNSSVIMHANKITKKIADPSVTTGSDVKALRKKVEKEKSSDAPDVPVFKTPKGRTFRTDLDIPGKMSDQIRAHFGLARKSIGAGSMKTWDPASSTEAEKEAAKKRKEAEDKASAERKKEEAEKKREQNRQKQDGK